MINAEYFEIDSTYEELQMLNEEVNIDAVNAEFDLALQINNEGGTQQC